MELYQLSQFLVILQYIHISRHVTMNIYNFNFQKKIPKKKKILLLSMNVLSFSKQLLDWEDLST